MLGYYYKELDRCRKLLSTINATINLLTSTGNQYDDMGLSVSKLYIIDGEKTIINKKIEMSKSEVDNIRNKLANQTTAKVNARISELLALIEEELRKIAEAAAAANSVKVGDSK